MYTTLGLNGVIAIKYIGFLYDRTITSWEHENRSVLWIARNNMCIWDVFKRYNYMSRVTASETLLKQPSEQRIFAMDFSSLLETGETLVSSSLTHSRMDGSTSDLSVSSPTIVDNLVKFWISSGTSGYRYRIEVSVTTSLNQILEADGLLAVKDT